MKGCYRYFRGQKIYYSFGTCGLWYVEGGNITPYIYHEWQCHALVSGVKGFVTKDGISLDLAYGLKGLIHKSCFG